MIRILLFLLVVTTRCFAQDGGYYFGLKGGPSIGFQSWNDSKRSPIFRYHGAVYLETLGDESTVFAQVGYHVRGSALRNRSSFAYDVNGQEVRINPFVVGFEFRNISLALAMKKKYAFGGGDSKAYYAFGLRGEYTLNTNLQSIDSTNVPVSFALYRPFEERVRHFNGGLYLGGGLEFPFSDYVAGILELNICPDFTKQYFREPLFNVTDPYTGGRINVEAQSIRNVSIEISLGLRFTRRIEYID